MDLAHPHRSDQRNFSHYGDCECHDGGFDPNCFSLHQCGNHCFHRLLRVQEDTGYQG